MQVVITGGNRGIGLGLVKEFLKAGHTVVATARYPEAADELKSVAPDFTGKLTVAQLDVTDEQSVGNFAREVVGTRAVDVLINNAAQMAENDAKLENVDLNKVIDMFKTNTIGPMRVTQALLGNLQKSSHKIVANISSKMGSVADNQKGRAYGYRISKAALNMFNMSLARDYPELVATVFHPGWVRTDMGGPSAPTQVDESAAGLCKLICNLSPEDSGRFLDFCGEDVPW